MKIPYSFGYPFFLRVLIPGFAAAIILYPLYAPMINIVMKYIDISDQFLKKGGLENIATVIGIMSLILGFLTYGLDMKIYQILEGYSWPKFARNLGTKWFQKKIDKMKEAEFKINNKMKEAQSEDSKKKYILERALIWHRLSRFPIFDDKGENTAISKAQLPTLLGNVIDQYESYPETRYKMDLIFYWPRIWMILDKEKRREISNIWAEADLFVYLSFIFLFSGILYIIVYLFYYLGELPESLTKNVLTKLISNDTSYLYIGISLIIGFYVLYRISILFHQRGGEYYKSVFDIYKDKVLSNLKIPAQEELTSPEEFLYYSKYLIIRCPNPNCAKYFPRFLDKCNHCGTTNDQKIDMDS